MPYRVRDPEDIRRQFAASGQPYAVFIDNNLGSQPEYLRALCRALRPLEKIWSAAVTLDVTDDPSLVREMALAGCTGVFIGFETLTDENLVHARKRTPAPKIMPGASGSCATMASRSTAASSWASTATAKTPSRKWPTGSKPTTSNARRSTS